MLSETHSNPAKKEHFPSNFGNSCRNRVNEFRCELEKKCWIFSNNEFGRGCC